MIQESNSHTKTLSTTGRAAVKLKICGMKYPDNISDIALFQPDYMGFIFYENSSRYFDGAIPDLPKNIEKVGVFVNATLDAISEKVEIYQLDLVQLHGNETPEFCKALQTNLHKKSFGQNVKIIKVFSISDHFDFAKLKKFEAVCVYFLFDTKGKHPGGNGFVFNWNVLQHYPSTKPYFLSGGIGMDEVEQLKSFFQKAESKLCYAIDINSKFEIEAGLKNPDLLQTFIMNLSSNIRES